MCPTTVYKPSIRGEGEQSPSPKKKGKTENRELTLLHHGTFYLCPP